MNNNGMATANFIGGNGGAGNGGNGGNGADESISNSVTGSANFILSPTQNVTAGNSGGSNSSNPGAAGNAISNLSFSLPNSYVMATSAANGGSGGDCSNINGVLVAMRRL